MQMEESKAMEYLIDYMKRNHISVKMLADELGRTNKDGGETEPEPLLADEFLELCLWLHLRPEEVAAAIRDSE